MEAEQEMEVAQKTGAEQYQRMKWVVSREGDVEKKQQSKAEKRQQQEEMAAVEGWRREPQKGLKSR